jgi:serine/threonine-protein kinase ATR
MSPVTSASRQANLFNGTIGGSQPLPSTRIATHLAPTNGSIYPHFDREDFMLLLEESLGSDEDGQPNLGHDLVVNHKLICVIIKAGLDAIDIRSDDPFRKDNEYHDQIQRCLEVVHLAVDKTPDALFVISRSEDLGPKAENTPLFVWVVPKFLSLLLLDKFDSKLIANYVWPVLGKMLDSEKQCSKSSDLCTSITIYIEEMVEGCAYQDHKGYF